MDKFIIKSICKGAGNKYCRTEPPHPRRNAKNLYPLHRVILENKLGRLLSYNEIAHHVDGDKTNDSPDNIELMLRGEHTTHHHKTAPPVVVTCAGCRVEFRLTPWEVVQRMKKSRDGKFYCCKECNA
jgi:hypothetical protein